MHLTTVSHDLQVLQEYVNLIDDPELKLSVALKYKCHDVIINVSSFSRRYSRVCVFLRITHRVFHVFVQTYRDLKDRQQLTVYRDKLERDSVEYRKIQELLNNGVRGSAESFSDLRFQNRCGVRRNLEKCNIILQ